MPKANNIRNVDHSARSGATVLMLLTNAYDPDPRVRQEALTLLRFGLRVRLLAWDRDFKAPAEEEVEGVEVTRVHLRSRHGRGNTQILFYAAVYLKMLWTALRMRFDVVHCHDLDTLPIGFLIGKLKGKPIVYDAHESFPDMLHGSVHAVIRRALESLENFMIRRIDLLITVGETLRRVFAARGAKRSVVVGNWKRLEDYAISPADAAGVRERLGVPSSALLVICITQLLRDRKLAELVDATDQSPNVYTVIAGTGVLDGWLRERAALNPRIIHAGFLRGSDVSAYTCAGDVIYYGFDDQNPNARYSAPNKLYEALAAGKPLITGDFGEIGMVVRTGECGIVLTHYSPQTVCEALEVLQDPVQRGRMAANSRSIGQQTMNWARAEDVLRREYGDLLAGVYPTRAVRATAGD